MAFTGNRILESKESVWEHNSWDHVQWDPAQLQMAKEIVAGHKRGIGSEIDAGLSSKWDKFYMKNTRNFFKDRHWFEHELASVFQQTNGLDVLEIGCGTGSSVFPLLEGTSDSVRIHACDYSSVAVELVKTDRRFDPSRCNIFCHDISDSTTPLPLDDESMDLILFVFVLSAIPRSAMDTAISKALKVLKPGGKLFIRDYGLYDLAQLRMAPSNWIEGSQYRRGDSTLTYFFSLDELSEMILKYPFMRIQDIKEDKRLLVNRKRRLQMYRVWIQGIFLKHTMLASYSMPDPDVAFNKYTR